MKISENARYFFQIFFINNNKKFCYLDKRLNHINGACHWTLSQLPLTALISHLSFSLSLCCCAFDVMWCGVVWYGMDVAEDSLFHFYFCLSFRLKISTFSIIFSNVDARKGWNCYLHLSYFAIRNVKERKKMNVIKTLVCHTIFRNSLNWVWRKLLFGSIFSFVFRNFFFFCSSVDSKRNKTFPFDLSRKSDSRPCKRYKNMRAHTQEIEELINMNMNMKGR